MNWLIDTSVLLRTIQTGSLMQQVAINALGELRTRGDDLFVVLQNLIEFWTVATRPETANGFGFSIQKAAAQIAQIRLHFVVAKNNTRTYQIWEEIVQTYRVSGKPTHDAHIVAAMMSNAIGNILTFNFEDFIRYADIINVAAPADVVVQHPE